MKRILVTGAAGFVGTHFLNRLKNVPDVRVTAVFHARKPMVVGDNIVYVRADLENFDDCKRVSKDMDYVCSFAGRLSTAAIMAKNPLGPVRENTIIHVQMLEAASEAGVKKYLWLSSTTGYPAMDRSLREDDFFAADPPPPYESAGWTSRYIEKLAELYATKHKNAMTVISLRPTAIFGEQDDFNYETCHALPALVRRMAEGRYPLEIWGTGEDARDWLYVDDLIDACLLALEKIEGYEVLNIGHGRVYNLNQLADMLFSIENQKHREIVHRLGKAASPVSIRRIDCSKAESVLGFRAKTPIAQALTNTIRWCKASPEISGRL